MEKDYPLVSRLLQQRNSSDTFKQKSFSNQKLQSLSRKWLECFLEHQLIFRREMNIDVGSKVTIFVDKILASIENHQQTPPQDMMKYLGRFYDHSAQNQDKAIERFQFQKELSLILEDWVTKSPKDFEQSEKQESSGSNVQPSNQSTKFSCEDNQSLQLSNQMDSGDSISQSNSKDRSSNILMQAVGQITMINPSINDQTYLKHDQTLEKLKKSLTKEEQFISGYLAQVKDFSTEMNLFSKWKGRQKDINLQQPSKSSKDNWTQTLEFQFGEDKVTIQKTAQGNNKKQARDKCYKAIFTELFQKFPKLLHQWIRHTQK